MIIRAPSAYGFSSYDSLMKKQFRTLWPTYKAARNTGVKTKFFVCFCFHKTFVVLSFHCGSFIVSTGNPYQYPVSRGTDNQEMCLSGISRNVEQQHQKQYTSV